MLNTAGSVSRLSCAASEDSVSVAKAVLAVAVIVELIGCWVLWVLVTNCVVEAIESLFTVAAEMVVRVAVMVVAVLGVVLVRRIVVESGMSPEVGLVLFMVSTEPVPLAALVVFMPVSTAEVEVEAETVVLV